MHHGVRMRRSASYMFHYKIGPSQSLKVCMLTSKKGGCSTKKLY